jgi:alpha-L-fucosidase
MFIYFGMSTFDGNELSHGDKPASFYNPDKLDVDQWIAVARDAGMKYALLTTKYVAGFCFNALIPYPFLMKWNKWNF